MEVVVKAKTQEKTTQWGINRESREGLHGGGAGWGVRAESRKQVSSPGRTGKGSFGRCTQDKKWLGTGRGKNGDNWWSQLLEEARGREGRRAVEGDFF